MQKILFRVCVSGESMWPELVSGRRYWASALLRPRVGDSVVFQSPHGEGMFVKKVSRVADGGYTVKPLVPWGSGSKDFGVVPRGCVLGVVL